MQRRNSNPEAAGPFGYRSIEIRRELVGGQALHGLADDNKELRVAALVGVGSQLRPLGSCGCDPCSISIHISNKRESHIDHTKYHSGACNGDFSEH